MLDAGFRIQDSGFRIQDSGCWIQDSGFKILDSGFRIQDSRFWMLNQGSRFQDSEFSVAGHFVLAFGLAAHQVPDCFCRAFLMKQDGVDFLTDRHFDLVLEAELS